jgi:hypothetical protein
MCTNDDFHVRLSCKGFIYYENVMVCSQFFSKLDIFTNLRVGQSVRYLLPVVSKLSVVREY